MLDSEAIHQIVLGSGDAKRRNLLRVLDDPLWESPDRVVIGASVAEDLHPVLAAAVAELCRWIAGDSPRLCTQSGGQLYEPAPASPAAAHLCRWILAQARAAVREEPSTTVGELQMLMTSAGYRASALEHLLDEVRPEGHCAEIVEIGAAVGLISWLVAANEHRAVRRVMLVDPNRRYELAAQQLWGSFTAGGSDRCAFLAKMPAYRFPFAAKVDVVLVCQTLHAVPPHEREAFLVRCWDALKPNGTLIINEIVVDDPPSVDEDVAKSQPEAPRRGELVALLSQFAEPRLYREVSNWRRAEDPLSTPAREYYASSFILLQRD